MPGLDCSLQVCSYINHLLVDWVRGVWKIAAKLNYLSFYLLPGFVDPQFSVLSSTSCLTLKFGHCLLLPLSLSTHTHSLFLSFTHTRSLSWLQALNHTLSPLPLSPTLLFAHTHSIRFDNISPSLSVLQLWSAESIPRTKTYNSSTKLIYNSAKPN